ncbi:MAG: adenylate/guanylate cyclase domain-containing protein [Actinomycetia bacterium]|nr:adenylate/guanylate cyclase domain-containing protein [Actinomycetes bacterium]
MGRRTDNISIATRIAVAITVIAVGALVVTLVYGSIVRDEFTRSGLEARFSATAVAKADELDRYVASLRSDTLQLAASPMIVEAAQSFSTAYGELPSYESLPDEQKDSLLAEYRDDVVPGLSEARGHPIPIRDVLPVTSEARYLQTVYAWMAIQDDLAPVNIDDARDGSSWSDVHLEFHPSLRATAEAFGFSDIFLVDPDTTAIVYSVAKNSDFATSLAVGPVGGSGFSTLVQRIAQNPQPGTVSTVDFSRYDPDIAAPVAFFGSPVFDGDRLVSVLVAKITPERLTEITTQGGDWDSMRIGEQGEILIVGPEGRLRSDSRAYLEDPDRYFDAAVASGTLDSGDVGGVQSAGTTVLFQRMDASTFRALQSSPDEMVASNNYLGEAVFTSIDEIGDGTVGWKLIVQVQRGEALAISDDAERMGAIAVSIFVLILTFIAAMWAASFIRPIVVLSLRLKALVVGGDGTKQAAALSLEATRTTAEFAELTDAINSMLVNLNERERSAVEAEAERIEVIRRFLPRDAARQIASGERSIERAAHASVVSVAITDMGASGGDNPVDSARERIASLVETLDQIAVEHDLKRVKVVGDLWVAVCGLGTPHVDHVARCLALAEDIVDIHLDGDRTGKTVAIAIGIASGPVSAGLAGSNRLVYDAWGAPVDQANDLARVAKPGEIVVSESVVEQLPSGVISVQRPVGTKGRVAWTIDPDVSSSEVPA